MRAIRISRHGGPEVLEWVDVPPPRPGPGEALVRVRACALNHLDLWVRKGVEGHRFPLPLIPGSEIAGDVVEAGELVTEARPGDAVLVAPGVCTDVAAIEAGRETLSPAFGILGEERDGGYAEYVRVPGRNLLSLPAGLTYVEAAALPLTFLTAWHMLVARAALAAHEDVLIHAAGSGVSTAALQIARLRGARHILVTAGTAAKLERARRLGATHGIDTLREDFVQVVREITAKKGADVVVDHVGGDTFERSLKALARGGRLVLCGATAGHLVQVNLRPLFFKSQSILGSTMGTIAELRTVLQHVERGDLEPVVDTTFPFERAREAQEYLESRQAFGKVVLTMGEG